MNASDFLDGLEDDHEWAGAPSENIRPFGTCEEVTEMPAGPQFKQRCDKCQGSGRFRTRFGRDGGACFGCKGEGFLTFKTSPESRFKRSKAGRTAAWVEANADVVAWVKRRSTGDRPFQFAVELAAKLEQYGTLTDGATETVKRLIKQDAERALGFKARAAEEKAAAPEVSIEPVLRAFAHAKLRAEEDAKRKLGGDSERATFSARLRLGGFYIEPSFKYAGALMVFRTDDRAILGKIEGGRFNRWRACDDATQAAIVEACADPEAAAVAWGRLHSKCSVCGRGLDNYESIQRGIGPICAGRMGWGG